MIYLLLEMVYQYRLSIFESK